MRTIPLTNSAKVAVVNNSDYAKLSQRKWYLTKKGYARSTASPICFLHEAVMGKAPLGKQWDHRDTDKLNNRKQNLRLSTQSQNKANSKKYRNNSTGFKGIQKFGNLWYARVDFNGKPYNVKGGFKTPEEAARARDKKAFQLYREFANLNFPIRRFPRLPRFPRLKAA